MKRILIIGSWNTTHVRRFISVLIREAYTNLIIDAYDPRFEDSIKYDIPVNHVYSSGVKTNWFYKIRKIGTYFFERRKLNRLKNLLEINHYDLINIHQIPHNALEYVRVAHRCNTKIMLTPFGSDVLRVSKIYKKSLSRAFHEADYVSANLLTGFADKIKTQYNIPESKLINLGYGSETITAILEQKGKINRKQQVAMLDIPYSNYYITCGYTASMAQRHSLMIEAIKANKDLLPKDYCVLIPLSYGPAKEQLKIELSTQCIEAGLNYRIIEDYLTVEQVAALRLITDIFIHIQPTDAYNASLQEFILAGAKCINGKWLDYPSLERHGAPYYVCDSLEDLPKVLKGVLCNELPELMISNDVIEEIEGNAWVKKIQQWITFYTNI